MRVQLVRPDKELREMGVYQWSVWDVISVEYRYSMTNKVRTETKYYVCKNQKHNNGRPVRFWYYEVKEL